MWKQAQMPEDWGHCCYCSLFSVQGMIYYYENRSNYTQYRWGSS